LSLVEDLSVADWIAPRLGAFGGPVSSVIPRGFPAYARVLHPVVDRDGRSVTWSVVCAKTGRVAHPLMQWQSINSPGIEDGTGNSTSGGISWDGDEPLVGRLEPQTLAALCRLLEGHTDLALGCFFALWEGWGWIPGGKSVAVLRTLWTQSPAAAVPPAFPEEMMTSRRLSHPGRNYLLFTGPLEAALDLGHWPSQEWFVPQSPSLIWPADNSWCLATEIDFDSTLIAGDQHLIDAVLNAEDLEATRIEPSDYLDSRGDTVNL